MKILSRFVQNVQGFLYRRRVSRHLPTIRSCPQAWLCVILFLVVSWNAWGQSPSLQKGMELLRQGDYAGALPEFERAERVYPHNAAIENVLGIIESKLGHWQAANQYYEKAIRLAPKFEDAHKNLGFNYLTEKRFRLAEEQLKIATALKPSDPFAHYYLALLYLAMRRDRQAVQQAAPSLKVLQNDPQASLEMIKACLRLNETKAALPLVNDLEQRSSLSPSQQYQLAMALFQRRQYPQAVELLQRMVRADPKSWRDRYDLAIGLLITNQPAEAVSQLVPLTAQRPQNGKILNLLGIAYEAEGKSAKALKMYQRAVHEDPSDPNRYLDYTRMLMNAGRYDESERFVEAGLRLVPDSYALEMRLGAVQMFLGKYGEARESFHKAIEAHPEIALGYVALAQTYLRQNQNNQAAEVLAKVRKKLRNQFVLQYFYGIALLRLGRFSEATQVLKDAVGLKTENPDAHFQLGMAYMSSSQLNQAQREFKRTIQLAPNYANAYYQLARIYAKRGEIEKARQMANRTRQLQQARYEAALKAQDALLKGVQQESAH